MKYYTIKVMGIVQGVSFRAATKAVADQLQIRGIIRNEKDGSVYIEAQGDDQMMEQFLEWCQEGPDESRVTGVEILEAPKMDHKYFEIKK